jgi:hypothetical protein
VEDIRQEVLAQGWIADISGTTIWRWLTRDALCPWRHRTWIFPRDPRFAQKAGPILDLYQGRWEGQPLGPSDFVISADEKTSIQARQRIHASLPPAPGRPALVEHEYERRGAWAYLAAWDVHRSHGNINHSASVIYASVRLGAARSRGMDGMRAAVLFPAPFPSSCRGRRPKQFVSWLRKSEAVDS